MPLLTELKEQLEKLPKKKQLKILAGAMKKYGELVGDTAASLKKSLDGARYAASVFPEEDFGKAVTRVRQAATLAARLRKKFADDINAVAKSASEQDVTRLGESAKAARAALKERWQELLSERIAPHQKLVEVVREIPELAPQGGATLGELLDELQSQVAQSPASQKDADSIRESLEELPRVIEKLGLEGEVGDFLVQAASGLGDPKKLYQPAIRSFFEKRDLWGLLRVRIR